MNIKKTFSKLSGYWIHKLDSLPIGTDLFFDINNRLRFGELKTVFDVGANEGQTLKWIKHFQPNANVHSFEPVKSSFIKLQKTAEKMDNCVLLHSALGNETGQMDIKLFDDYSVLNSLKPTLMNQHISAEIETIKINTLDNYCNTSNINHIDLLKIDVEGFEIEVLKGADNFLTEGKISFVYSEVGFQSNNSRNTPFNHLVDFLEKKGFFFYALYQLDDHDWKNGNHLGNALFIHSSVYP